MSTLRRSSVHPLLLIVPDLSNATRQMLTDAEISYITQRDGLLHLGGKTLALGDSASLASESDASAATTPGLELPWRGRSAFQVLR